MLSEDACLTASDEQLMLEVRDDNPVAFAELIERYRHRLIEILGEQLTQDVLLHLFRTRRRYDAACRFPVWLFTIVAHRE